MEYPKREDIAQVSIHSMNLKEKRLLRKRKEIILFFYEKGWQTASSIG